MRPIKLTVSAFLAYADQCVFELDKLGTSGIYLITGDTGAGKTTIFDAITFSLYGISSGGVRDSSMLVSKYASDNTPTFVEFVFEYNNEIYTVSRNPSFLRKKKKGDGYATENPDATLIMPDESVITGINNVNSKIEEIIGIGFSQFTQIAMIAQGKFLKLIDSSTTERQEIFRDIFNTVNFQKFQDKLKNLNSSAKVEDEKINASTLQYISDIECGSDEFSILLKDEIDKGIVSSKLLDLLDALIENDSLEYDKLDFLDREIFEKISLVKSNLEKILDAEKNIILIDQCRSDLKILESNILESFKKNSYIDSLVVENKKIENYINSLEKDKSKYIDLEESLKEKESKKIILKNLDNNKKLFACELLKNEKKLEDVHKNILEKNLIINSDVNYENDLTKKELILSDLKKYIECVLEKNKIVEKISKEKILFDDKKLEEEKKSKEYEIDFKNYIDNQAGILAEYLEEGKACSVCGSIHHPSYALKKSDVLSIDELDLKKDVVEILKNECIKISEKLSGLNKDLKVNDEKQSEIVKKINFSLDGDVLEIKKNTENEIKILKEKIKSRMDALSILEILNEKEKKLNENISDIKNKDNINNNDITKCSTLFESIDANVLKIKKDLEFENLNDLLKCIEIKNVEKIKNLKIINEKLEFDKKNNDEKIRLETSILEKEASNKEASKLNKEKLLKQLEEFKILKENTVLSLNVILLRNDKNKKIFKNLKNKLIEGEQSSKYYQMIKKIHNTASGNISHNKVMFETFIQLTYFDKIIFNANQRFISMTGGQYELLRRKIPTSLSGKVGLDIDVLDHYNGTTRDIKSLSGGESFKASLCLALGLSDEVQSSCGGIKLDTMFIDEGFGSLDEESLRFAIDTLNDLSEGSKLIGIISHVSELKDRIDKQIIVKKGKSGGSYFKMIA